MRSITFIVLALLAPLAQLREAGKPSITPTSSQPGGPGTTIEFLERLNRFRTKIKVLETKFRSTYKTTDPVEYDSIKAGQIVIDGRSESIKFLIELGDAAPGGVSQEYSSHLTFDGEWFANRNDAEKAIEKHQIALPSQGHPEFFKLGRGTFALPYGNSSEEVLRIFSIDTCHLEKIDGKNQMILRLVPRKDSGYEDMYRSVEMRFDNDSLLPISLTVISQASDSRTVLEFQDTVLRDKPTCSLSPKEPRGYSISRFPLPRDVSKAAPKGSRQPPAAPGANTNP